MSRQVSLPVDRDELAAVIPILEAAGIRDSYGEDAEPLPRFLRRAKIKLSELNDEQAAAEAAGEDAALAPPSLADGLTAEDKAWMDGRE